MLKTITLIICAIIWCYIFINSFTNKNIKELRMYAILGSLFSFLHVVLNLQRRTNMWITVYMIRNKKSKDYIDWDGNECEFILDGTQWFNLLEAKSFLMDLDEPSEFEIVGVKMSYEEMGVIK